MIYSQDTILVLLQWIIKQDYKNNYIVTGDWRHSTRIVTWLHEPTLPFLRALCDDRIRGILAERRKTIEGLKKCIPYCYNAKWRNAEKVSIIVGSCMMSTHLRDILLLSLSSVYPPVSGNSLYRKLRRPSPHDTEKNVIKRPFLLKHFFWFRRTKS